MVTLEKDTAIQDCLTNELDPRARRVRHLAGILGESPSRYAKSPSIWNPVLKSLRLDALYLPFDVEAGRLGDFVEAARREERLRGFSVTMPYKTAVMPFLDAVDPTAQAIGAVNTVVRTEDGRLVGSNTDGSGGLASLTTPAPGEPEPFLADLAGTDLLLLGAGGAGKALAWSLAEAIGKGRLAIATRGQDAGVRLCAALKAVNPRVMWVPEAEIERVAPAVHLIINATTKGQAGIRTLPDGTVTCLEPYSALAPAKPAALPAAAAADPERFYRDWFRLSLPDVMVNQARSARLLVSIPTSVRIVDIIYAPVETALLRQARCSGHRTLNGKGMNICQAADALFHRVFRAQFERTGHYEPATYRKILELMYRVW
ncbi:shikimate dehydrogenase family protein [Nitrospira sp. Kam-Ns4a]